MQGRSIFALKIRIEGRFYFQFVVVVVVRCRGSFRRQVEVGVLVRRFIVVVFVVVDSR